MRLCTIILLAPQQINEIKRYMITTETQEVPLCFCMFTFMSGFPGRNSFSSGGLLARLQNTFPSLRTRFSAMGSSTAEISTTLEIYRVPCLQDNYVWLLKVVPCVAHCVQWHECKCASDFSNKGRKKSLQDQICPCQEIKSGLTAIVDASEVNPIVEALEERWLLTR